MNKRYMDELIYEIIEIRRYLHSNPELSLKEYETSKYIVEYLKKIGLNPKLIGETGVVATMLNNVKYPTIAIRAEIDALPINEETNKSYKSKVQGVMHACGHDAITATALGLAKMLFQNREKLRCNVKFIFEPGEEIGKGSKKLIEENVLEDPSVDKIIFFHYTNEDVLGMNMQKNIVSATVGGLSINVKGKSTHWSEYEKGVDAILASGKVIQAIENINNNYKLKHPFIIGIGKINGGTSKNIVAENVEISGSLRTYSIEEYKKIISVLREKMKLIEKESKVKITIEASENPIPPMYNSPDLIKKAMKVGKNVFGERCTISDTTYLSGDNASFYLKNTEGLFIAFFDQKEKREVYPLHNSKFDINERVFGFALKVLYDLIFEIY